jgi:hypothetical protein
MFGLSKFSLSKFSLSRFGLSRFGLSRFGHGFQNSFSSLDVSNYAKKDIRPCDTVPLKRLKTTHITSEHSGDGPDPEELRMLGIDPEDLA